MLFIFIQLELLVQLIEGTVYSDADIAGFAGLFKGLGVLALFTPHHRGHHLDAGALRQRKHLVDDLVDGLLPDFFPALGAVRRTGPGPEKAQIVIDFRHSAHGGPGVFGRGLLVDGNGGTEAVDVVHVGLVHLAQKHPGVGRKALHIPPLTLGIDGVKSQRGLARPAEAGQDHQLVTRNGHVNILQIVGTGALHNNFVLHCLKTPHFSPSGSITAGRELNSRSHSVIISAVSACKRASRPLTSTSTCAPIFPAEI
ncbi:hypothetical protein SDC9_91553 [bioreactor metagenome]|uniref:Uncharacterized protein n=1 Tax=bioreactor metagenome TaxID=1076179 RepID=A0A644ZY54_9ZZZZ